MTESRIHRWRLPLLLAVVCLVFGSLLLWQLDKQPPVGDAGQQQVEADATARSDTPASGDEGGDGSATATEGDSDAETATTDESQPPDEDDAFNLPPLADFSAIVERPLFIRGRRPAPPAADDTTAAATSEGKSPFVLSGVMIVGGRRVAFLQTRVSPRTIRVEEGETVEGWKVAAIRAKAVTVVSGENKEQLELPDRIAVPGAVAAAPRQPGRIPNGDQTRPNNGQPPIMPPGRPSEQPPDPDMEPE